MPHLEIRKRDGSLERRELDPRGQLTIGASPAADVRLDTEGILPIECRITGVKGEFVLATNNPAGTRLNGEVVQKIRLREPAVVRIADVEIHFREQAVPAAGKTGALHDGNRAFNTGAILTSARRPRAVIISVIVIPSPFSSC